MKLTKSQKEAILPLLQAAVQAKIDCWDSQRQIEGVLGKEFDNMEAGIEDLAIGCDGGDMVSAKDVQKYLDGCEEVG